VPAHIGREQAQEEVRADPVLAPVVDGAHLELARLEDPEVPLHLAEPLVGEDHPVRVHALGCDAGADDVEPIEGGLGGDGLGAPLIAEGPLRDDELEVLGHLVAVLDPADPHPDGRGAAQRPACHGGGDAREVGLGGDQQRLALARPLRGEDRVATDHQALAREVGAGDLDEVALVEERELQRALQHEAPDGRCTQGAQPADAAHLAQAGDARAREHPAVPHEDHPGQPERVA